MTKEMYEYLHTILDGRAHNRTRDTSARMAYLSCLWMLEYAEAGDLEGLKNYDYDERAPQSGLAGQMLRVMMKERN